MPGKGGSAALPPAARNGVGEAARSCRGVCAMAALTLRSSTPIGMASNAAPLGRPAGQGGILSLKGGQRAKRRRTAREPVMVG